MTISKDKPFTAFCAVQDGRGKLLVCKRSDMTPEKPYGLLGGLCDEDDADSSETAVREVFEEAGLDLRGFIYRAQRITIYLDGKRSDVYGLTMSESEISKMYDPDRRSTPDEGVPVWITPEEFLEGTPWADFNRTALRAFGMF